MTNPGWGEKQSKRERLSRGMKIDLIEKLTFEKHLMVIMIWAKECKEEGYLRQRDAQSKGRSWSEPGLFEKKQGVIVARATWEMRTVVQGAGGK